MNLKVEFVDHTTRTVIDKFNPADRKALPAELVKFMEKLPKGDKLKPMDKDTFQLSTVATTEYKKYGGHTFPAERRVEIMLPNDENAGYYACLTDNKQHLEDKKPGFFPLTVEGFKTAIRSIAKSKNYFEAGK